MIDFEKYKKTGDFILSSGAKSDVYYDIKEAMGEPENLHEFIRILLDKRYRDLKNIDVIAGIEYGGIPLAVGLSLYTDIPYVIIRKHAKSHGTKQLLEGYKKKGRVLLLDDVRTSGSSLKNAKEYLESLGYKVVAIDVAFEREI